MSEGSLSESSIAFAIPEVTSEDVAAVTAVLRSGWLTTGTEALAFESELSTYLGGSDVIAVSSCTTALEIALAHLRLPQGSRVGVPAWTFASTGLAAVRNGLHPVLIDVEPDTLNLSAQALDVEAPNLQAVIPVHFAGTAVSVEVHETAANHGLHVIEDAAHALGTTDHRGKIGSPGTSHTCFSFYATKNLSSGEGGAIATTDPDLAKFARTYRLHGMDADAWARYRPGAKAGYDITEPGIKANFPDLLATLGRSQLKRFDHMQAKRRAIVERYRANLTEAQRNLGLGFVPGEMDSNSADHLMIVVLPERTKRDDVVAHMSANNIGT
ncbi:MAG: DegT/DnrJ/EryC1/StrS family aminotransferase, partial [Acidimicrobiales bacterium]|nr:DegT/DnrJ/EryC1/StrS family aminotransferase [Acidimicrobiales bacterium]